MEELISRNFVMAHGMDNRFQDFFTEQPYVVLKNYLYNYLLRKRAVRKSARRYGGGCWLEVGSGISPMLPDGEEVVYSDLSFDALLLLKKTSPAAACVVADGMHLPFRSGVFRGAVCSEVLEHIEKDGDALKELARVIRTAGTLIITVPHRKCYFALDDRFVGHYRRYEVRDMIDRLKEQGLRAVHIEKVLGPLEKVTMWGVVFCYSVMEKRLQLQPDRTGGQTPLTRCMVPLFQWLNIVYMGIAWLDARIMPRSLSTVLLIKAEKVRN